jgi:ubiquinone/menaquinone biosynthesis C-methylase UbiE
VDVRDAVELIRAAVPPHPGIWMDVGAGRGTFSLALAQLLGPGSRIYAVDRDAKALAALRRAAPPGTVITVTADFSQPFEPSGLEQPLDGLLCANSLHFVARTEAVLGALASSLRPGGRVVVVEYEQRNATRWVPYPLPPERLAAVARAAGLTAPAITAMRPSAFGGNLYVAVAQRVESAA